jgi:hypothetical protein
MPELRMHIQHSCWHCGDHALLNSPGHVSRHTKDDNCLQRIEKRVPIKHMRRYKLELIVEQKSEVCHIEATVKKPYRLER